MNKITIELNPSVNGIKGYITEIVAKLHFESSGFHVIQTGKEHYSIMLADFAASINSPSTSNRNDSRTFSIYNDILGKMPDLMLFRAYTKNDNIVYTIRFVEVKFRKGNLSLQKKEHGYLYTHDGRDELSINKYIENIKNINGGTLQNVNFFIYLLFCDNDDNYRPLIGKVTDCGNIDFYEISLSNDNQLKNWGWGSIALFSGYIDNIKEFISDYFILHNLLLRSREDIAIFIKEKWMTALV